MSFFIEYLQNISTLLNKNLCFGMGYLSHKDEHTYHYNYLNNSYGKTPMWFYDCIGVCCNSTLPGRKGVMKNELF